MKIDTKEFLEKQREVLAQLRVEGEKVVRGALKQVFETHPEIEAIKWAQYTPYFNDGEECVFGVNEVRVKIKGGDEEAGDYEDGFVDSYDVEEKGLKETMKAINTLFSETEDVLKATFGDHAEITATVEKIEVEEYDHE